MCRVDVLESARAHDDLVATDGDHLGWSPHPYDPAATEWTPDEVTDPMPGHVTQTSWRRRSPIGNRGTPYAVNP